MMSEPAYGEIADEDDLLGWDVDKHGRMIEYASDDVPETVCWEDEDGVSDDSTDSA